MSDPRDLANDLGRAINARLRQSLAADINGALALGIEPSEVAIMGMKIAASIANAFILVAVQMRKDGVDPSRFYDDSLATLNALMPSLKDEGLALVERSESGAFS